MTLWKAAVYNFKRIGSLVDEASTGPDPGLVVPSHMLSMARRVVLRPGASTRGSGALESVLLDEGCEPSAFTGSLVLLILPEVVQSPLARRALSGFTFSTVAK